MVAGSSPASRASLELESGGVVRAHILSIGSELLLGHITDTNATFLAQELAGLGVDLCLVKQVGDGRDDIAAEIRRSLQETDLIITTGGVGPTVDDQTREAVALAMGEEPVVDHALLEIIHSFFAARGLEMPERNAKQAWLIPSAESLPNPNGTAPGWFVRKDNKFISSMPGVPREMYPMWRDQAVPRLTPFLDSQAISTITLKTIGIGESALEELLGDLAQLENPAVATYAKDDGVHIRITAIAGNAAAANDLRERTVMGVRDRADAYVYGQDATTLPAAITEMLRERGLTLAIADRNAGARFWSMFATEPGSGEIVIAGELLQPTGPDEAEAAARLLASSGAGIAMAIGVEQQGASGVITVAVAAPTVVVEQATMRGSLPELQRRSALLAADVLRRYLIVLPVAAGANAGVATTEGGNPRIFP